MRCGELIFHIARGSYANFSFQRRLPSERKSDEELGLSVTYFSIAVNHPLCQILVFVHSLLYTRIRDKKKKKKKKKNWVADCLEGAGFAGGRRGGGQDGGRLVRVMRRRAPCEGYETAGAL